MAFEWDEEKRKANLIKHGVDFRQMPELFDGAIVEVVDSRQDYGETRINCVGEVEGAGGEVGGRVYAVAYTWRGANRWIISARKANAREQKTYYARVER